MEKKNLGTTPRTSRTSESDLSKFAELDGNAARIRYCIERMKNSENLYCGRNGKMGKNELQAIEARKQGNVFYKKDQDYVRALEYYNKSLALSPNFTENIALCYGNRSAIYFTCQLYRECKFNIKKALSYSTKIFSGDSRTRLEDRLTRLECHRMDGGWKSSNVKFIDLPTLCMSYAGYNFGKERGIIQDLSLWKSVKGEFGRFVYTHRDLNPGDVVAIDTPVFRCLNEDSIYIKCDNCSSSNFLNLIPCKGCSKVMYCGEECQQVAYKSYHQYECCCTEANIAVRATLTAFSLFNGQQYFDKSLKSLVNFVKEKNFDIFSYNKSVDCPFVEAVWLIYTLATNEDKRSIEDIYTRSKTLARIYLELNYFGKGDFGKIFKKKEEGGGVGNVDEENTFLEMLMHFSQVATTNCHELQYMTRSRGADEIETMGKFSPGKYGVGLSPIIGMFNHSCAPNVACCTFYDDIMRVVVVRKINSGDQLFISYDQIDYMRLTSRDIRRAILFEKYLFECKCKACLQGWSWPPMDDTSTEFVNFVKCITTADDDSGGGVGSLKKIWPKDSTEGCRKKSLALAGDLMPKCIKYLKKFGDGYPSFVNCLATNLIVVCCNILWMEKPVDYDLSFTKNKKNKN